MVNIVPPISYTDMALMNIRDRLISRAEIEEVLNSATSEIVRREGTTDVRGQTYWSRKRLLVRILTDVNPTTVVAVLVL